MEVLEKLKGLSNNRNLLIHEYTIIDTAKLIDFLDYLDDFREFARQIQHSVS